MDEGDAQEALLSTSQSQADMADCSGLENHQIQNNKINRSGDDEIVIEASMTDEQHVPQLGDFYKYRDSNESVQYLPNLVGA